MKTSLLLSVYKNNTIDEVNRCFKSIETQSDYPNEIVLIIDGPIDNTLREYIETWIKYLPLKVFKLDKNMGLAYALNYGMKLCKYDWVFRIDIDDVCAKDRFAIQKKVVSSNNDLDILGGNIQCFKKFPQTTSARRVPSSFKSIRKYMKYRNPINHSSVFFNKKKILSIGGYPNARLGQDYLLWINAVNSGLKIQNIDETLVYMKVDNNSRSRRGLKNLKYDSYPYIVMYKKRMINIFELFIGLSMRMSYCIYSSIRSIINL